MESFTLQSVRQDQDLVTIRQIIEKRDERRYLFVLFPNPNKSLNDFHSGIIVDNETENRFYMKYNINLL